MQFDCNNVYLYLTLIQIKEETKIILEMLWKQ